MDGDIFLDDESVLDELLDMVSRGGEPDLGEFLVVQPNSVLAAFEHAGSESSL